jgi:hypothetical protein
LDKIAAILLVALLVIVFAASLSYYILNQPNQTHNNPSPTPTPTKTPAPIVVTKVTTSPSNDTPGLVTVSTQVQNNRLESDNLLVVMQIQEPNGSIMSIPNNTSTVEIAAGTVKTVTFLPMIPLNTKIGEFNVDIDVYNLNQTVKYCSTGFIYPFTTPIKYHISFSTRADITNYEMTVDGITYKKQSMNFYWYLGTNHTISVPQIITNAGPPFFNPNVGWQFSKWEHMESENIVSKGNTLYVYVAADTPTYRITPDYVRWP